MDFKPDHKADTEAAVRRGASTPEGWVFDIKRFSVHDGPGIRTTVFLKGCSLRCVWCHNPESIDTKPELLVYPMRCISCGECKEVCPQGAHRVAPSGERIYDRSVCIVCGRCVESCYAEALVLAGKKTSVEEVMTAIREDSKFYEKSGGGVTLSGGEPLLQGEFATAILRECKAEGFHTAVETCGQVSWANMEKALPYVDLWLYDLKHFSPDSHERYTGSPNRLILENLSRISSRGAAVEVHMLIVPTINDSRDEVESAARFLASLPRIEAVRLLSYHRLAGSKYESLGRENTMPDVPSPTIHHLQKVARWIRQYGIHVFLPERGTRQRHQGDGKGDKRGEESSELLFHLGDEEKRPW
jgi:pyruvate formate lyase activating enzyme